LLFENLRPRLSVSSGQLPETGDLNGGRTSSPAEAAGSSATSHQPPATGKFHAADALASIVDLGDAPSCHVCGSIMVRNGSCYKCMSCGSTSGCS